MCLNIKYLLFIVIWFFTVACEEAHIRAHVAFLADSIGNRYPASEGDLKARDYISEQFLKSGLECKSHSFYIAEYTWGTGSIVLHKNNSVTDFTSGDDFSIRGNCISDTLMAEYVVVRNYLPDSLNHYIRDKIVIYLHQPSVKDSKYPYLTVNYFEQAGAGAVIYVMSPGIKIKNVISKGNRNPVVYKIPVLNLSYDRLEEFIPKDELKNLNGVYMPNPSYKLKIEVQHHEKRIPASNILGLKKGKNNKYIIIGAHYDTCGPDLKNGEYRRGANDNASGVAMTLALSERLKTIQTNHNIIFAAFGGEEKGRLGSQAFVEHITLQNIDITEMVNLDIVGKMNNGILYFRQFNNAKTTPSSINSKSLVLTTGHDFMSDHADFVDAGIPATLFHTGEDATIHTIDDTSDRLNYDGMDDILDFLADYILALDSEFSCGSAGCFRLE